MKVVYFILVLFIVFSGLWLLNRDPIAVDVSPGTLKLNQNPMRFAPELARQVAKQPLDFAELETPFAPDAIGTEVDGQLRVDEFGDLIIDTQLKSFFDYFLSSVGQVTPEQAIRRIQLYIARDLEEPAATKAREVLENYLAFKEASLDLMAQPIDTNKVETDINYRHEQLKYALAQLKQLRREYMGDAEATAFFLDEEAYGDYTIRNQSISLNEELSEQEKQQQRHFAQAQLPDHMREHVVKQEQQAKRSQALTKLLASSPSIDEFSNFAYANYSAEEAENLLNHYKQEFQFKQLYQVYRQAVEALESQGLTETQWASEKSSLANQYFDDNQLSMVKALDQGLAQSE